MRLNLIWYHFILNLEKRAWNLLFLSENVLHLNNKTKPCFLPRIIKWCSVAQSCSAFFVNSQIGAFAFAKISCSDKLAAMSVRRYISSVFRLCYPNSFTCICIYLKPKRGNKHLERKATLHFCFGKTETSAQAGTELWRCLVVFISARAVQLRKAADCFAT